MQIQLREGAVLRGAEGVPQGRGHDAARQEVDYDERGWRRLGLKRPEKEIRMAESQRDTERVEARGIFELERVVSCGRGDRRWRTKLQFGSSEPFDDSHRSTAFGTASRWRGVFAAECLWFDWWLLCRAE